MRISIYFIFFIVLSSCSGKLNKAAYKELSSVHIENLDDSVVTGEIIFNLLSITPKASEKKYILQVSCDEKFKIRSYNSILEEGVLQVKFSLYKDAALLYRGDVSLEVDLPIKEDLYEGYIDKYSRLKDAMAIAAEQINSELLLFFTNRDGEFN